MQALVYLGQVNTGQKNSPRIINKIVEAKYWLLAQHEALKATDISGVNATCRLLSLQIPMGTHKK